MAANKNCMHEKRIHCLSLTGLPHQDTGPEDSNIMNLHSLQMSNNNEAHVIKICEKEKKMTKKEKQMV